MDKRIKYRIVLDTETAPLNKDLEKVTPQNMLVYDVGYAIVDKRGHVYKTRSFVNRDVFIGEKDLMKSAYYANKIPQYWDGLKNGTKKMAHFDTIRRILLEDIKEYNVTQIYAHNARFDVGALNNTMRYLTKSKYRYFFPKNVTIYDTLKMSRQVVGNTPTYRRFCKENGYTTKRGAVRLTAEILYRYISHEHDFTEVHQGLDDVMIEKEIMAFCYRKHKKMDGVLYPAFA